MLNKTDCFSNGELLDTMQRSLCCLAMTAGGFSVIARRQKKVSSMCSQLPSTKQSMLNRTDCFDNREFLDTMQRSLCCLAMTFGESTTILTLVIGRIPTESGDEAIYVE